MSTQLQGPLSELVNQFIYEVQVPVVARRRVIMEETFGIYHPANTNVLNYDHIPLSLVPDSMITQGRVMSLWRGRPKASTSRHLHCCCRCPTQLGHSFPDLASAKHTQKNKGKEDKDTPLSALRTPMTPSRTTASRASQSVRFVAQPAQPGQTPTGSSNDLMAFDLSDSLRLHARPKPFTAQQLDAGNSFLNWRSRCDYSPESPHPP